MQKNWFGLALITLLCIPVPGISAIKFGPYLSQATTDSIVMTWITDTDTTTNKTLWGLTDALGTEAAQTFSESNAEFGLFSHVVTITGLAAGTSYHYKVSSDGEESASYTFKTAVNSGEPFAFSVIADSRNGHHVFSHFTNDMILRGTDFNIHAGDMVQFGGILDEWQSHFFDIANGDAGGPYWLVDNFMANRPLFYAFADHETYGLVSGDRWGNDKIALFFNPPENGIEKTIAHEDYYYRDFTYAFGYGNVYFIFLATGEEHGGISVVQQNAWLEQQLILGADYDYRVVVYHEACFNIIGSGNTDVQDQWAPLFEQYNVNIAFMGNAHAFNDTIKNGVHYMTLGGGGAEMQYGDSAPGNAALYGFTVEKTASFWHYAMVNVSSDGMRVRCIDTDGTVFHSILWDADPGTGTGFTTSTSTGSGSDPDNTACSFLSTSPLPILLGLMTAWLFIRKRATS